jgi:transposase
MGRVATMTVIPGTEFTSSCPPNCRANRKHLGTATPAYIPVRGRLHTRAPIYATMEPALRIYLRIDEADALIKKTAHENEACQRLMAIPGIGPVTATAVIAAIGNGGPSARVESSPPGWE